jgi:multisubunit Na+/H+ antiporter MnhC subunit
MNTYVVVVVVIRTFFVHGYYYLCFPFLVESEETPSAFPINTVVIAVAVVVTVALVLIAVVLVVVSRNRRSTIDLRKERREEAR